MAMQRVRPSGFCVAIVGVALVLLGIILVMVILLSARVRRAERVTAVPAAVQPPATPTNSKPPDAKTNRSHEKPVRVVVQPVKVIEKQVKVVEKQVRVVEKLVKVSRKPARERRQPIASNDHAPVPATRSSARVPATATFLETGLPNQLSYAGKLWNASDLVKDLRAELLATDSRAVDGHTIYHDESATSPFPCVYAKVADETDQYVRYVPTSS
jgi:Na+-transporting methylmalonyl-CoA/oxaloacetate decarboxylase gamma subunit